MIGEDCTKVQGCMLRNMETGSITTHSPIVHYSFLNYSLYSVIPRRMTLGTPITSGSEESIRFCLHLHSIVCLMRDVGTGFDLSSILIARCEVCKEKVVG